MAAAAARPAAVLFGSERNGLANEDLARCQALLRIPTDCAYESLNLAHGGADRRLRDLRWRCAPRRRGVRRPGATGDRARRWRRSRRILTPCWPDRFPRRGQRCNLRRACAASWRGRRRTSTRCTSCAASSPPCRSPAPRPGGMTAWPPTRSTWTTQRPRRSIRAARGNARLSRRSALLRQMRPPPAMRPGAARRAIVKRHARKSPCSSGAARNQIVFTSGATEANNLAILGAARSAPTRRAHRDLAHRAPRGARSCRQLEREGFPRHLARAARGRHVDRGRSSRALRRGHVARVADARQQRDRRDPGRRGNWPRSAARAASLLHVDAAQSAGKLPLDVLAAGSICSSVHCAHKLDGPKGVGALYVRRAPRPGARAAAVRRRPRTRVCAPGRCPRTRSPASARPAVAPRQRWMRRARASAAARAVLAGTARRCADLASTAQRSRRVPGILNVSIRRRRRREPARSRLTATSRVSTGSACSSASAASLRTCCARSAAVRRSRQARCASASGRQTTETTSTAPRCVVASKSSGCGRRCRRGAAERIA